VQTTFLTRAVAQSIILGYLVFILLLGLQSLLIQIGQRYWGVWQEHSWMNNFSTAYLPFLAAFTLGFKSSLSEEFMYRFFAINLGRKILKSSLMAVILGAIIWGFSHSLYPVFPVWFRGIEVTCLGFFMAWIYLRFGIIPVIIAHYAFNVFWSTAAYLFGTTSPYNFYTSLLIFLLPLFFGLVAFVLNRDITIKPLKWHLNKHQQFNLDVLKSYLTSHKEQFQSQSIDEIRRDIIRHGWDVAVVDVALEDWESNPQ
jgi:hypothetical protein